MPVNHGRGHREGGRSVALSIPLFTMIKFVSTAARSQSNASSVFLSKLQVCVLGFRAVSFTLQTKDVLSTVTDILKSCSLSVEHVKGIKASTEKPKGPPAAGTPFDRPIKWDKTYYTFTGYRDPEQELEQAKRVEPTLR